MRSMRCTVPALTLGLILATAPVVDAQQTEVFAVYGKVILHPAHNHPASPDTVRVTNLSTGDLLTAAVGTVEVGNYGVVFMDLTNGRAAAVGDSVVADLFSAAGEHLVSMAPRAVTAQEIADYGMVLSLPRFDGTLSFVAGTVTVPTGAPLAGMAVQVTDVLLSAVVNSTTTDAAGYYAMGLDLGPYSVELVPPAGSLYIGEYYDDIPSHDPANAAQAERLLLGMPTLRDDIDFELAEGGTFSGTVVDAQDGTPIFYADVYPFVFGATGLLRMTESQPGSGFTSVALPPGDYGAVVMEVGGYLDEFYLEAATLAEADPFAVPTGTNTPGIDFTLGRDPITVGNENPLPLAFVLGKPQPNPFNAGTVLSYDVQRTLSLRLSIFDIHGRLVRVLVDDAVTAGTYRATWDGRDAGGEHAAAGVYLIKLEGAGQSQLRRAVLMR